MMNEKGMLGSILSYAKPCKGKLILSVLCALISVAGGIVPFVRLIVLLSCFLMSLPQQRRFFFGAGSVLRDLS